VWQRHGVDTVAVLWPDQGGTELLSRIQAAPTVPYARGLLALDRGPSGARVMAWPEYGTVKLECRLGALVDGHRDSHRLGTRDELRLVGDVGAAELAALLGAKPDTRAVTVGRFDLVTERDCEASEGIALLRAMRALCPPGMKLRTFTAADGRVETVSVVTERGGRTIFRAYDKGVESGSNPPGERIRFEAQRQLAKRSRPGPNALANSDLAADFGRTIEPFVKGSPVTVTAPSAVVDQLAQQLANGDLTAARAERLVGAAELLRRYGRGVYEKPHQSARRLRALRAAGIAVDDELPPDATVPVTELLNAALAEWSS
jgi:hypothetical protein